MENNEKKTSINYKLYGNGKLLLKALYNLQSDKLINDPKGIEAGKSLEEWKDKVDFYDLNAHERYKALEGLCMELYASQRQGCETSNIISFGNHLRCEIKANANKIEVINAVNGWGDNIPLSEIDILSKELPQPPSNKL